MAREQPALTFLYGEIDRLTIGLDKDALRPKLSAITTLPASDLKRLPVSVLFITGAEDVFVPPAAAALAKLVPGAKLESVPEAGHSVYFQRPEVFNRLVSNFFESPASNGTSQFVPPRGASERTKSTRRFGADTVI
jgi:pimeloyl-ACP methyl ester carboxylesterase